MQFKVGDRAIVKDIQLTRDNPIYKHLIGLKGVVTDCDYDGNGDLADINFNGITHTLYTFRLELCDMSSVNDIKIELYNILSKI